MNAYQVMGIIVSCTAVFAGVVTLLTMQGVHILLALLGVYFIAVWSMLCMQRKARENFESSECNGRRSFDTYSQRSRSHATDFTQTPDVTSVYQE